MTAEPLTVDALVEQAGDLPRSLRLYPDYDTAYLRWLFAEVAAVEAHGSLVAHLVRTRSGAVAGWYLYYLAPGGIAQVLQVAAPGRDPEPVLDHLLWHAARGGAAAVQGRVEPHLYGALRARRYLLYRTQLALVHTADTQLLGLLGSPRALLTRLDGEWWMGHHLLWRDGQAGHGRPRALPVEAGRGS